MTGCATTEPLGGPCSFIWTLETGKVPINLAGPINDLGVITAAGYIRGPDGTLQEMDGPMGQGADLNNANVVVGTDGALYWWEYGEVLPSREATVWSPEGGSILVQQQLGVWAADQAWAINNVADCNGNGMGDHCDIVDADSPDCDGNDVPDECQEDCNSDGLPDVCEPDCNGNGQPDPCDILHQTSTDCNFNGIPDECDGGRVVTAVTAHDPPIELWENVEVHSPAFVVDAGTIEDVDLTLDMDYRIGDLTVLLSHGDVTITILDRPGYPEGSSLGNGQLGYRIVVDDEGAGDVLENVGNFGSPFEPITSPPSYRPDEPLSGFDGLRSEGLWTVHVRTSSNWSPVDEFDEWGLIITIAPEPACDCVIDDFSAYVDCVGGPGGPVSDSCRCMDMDADGDVDFADFGQFQLRYGG